MKIIFIITFAVIIWVTVGGLMLAYLKGYFSKKTYTTIARMKCKVSMGNLFGQSYKTDAYVILLKCDQNSKYSAYITDGMNNSSFDVEAAIYQARQLGYEI